nr:MAG TPA: hypothetical protein [Caudoviricetes sp.]
MAIQNRRGNYEDFLPEKMLPAEWAIVLSGDPVVTDGKSAFICFSPGDVKRIATHNDMVALFNSINADLIEKLTGDVTDAANAANIATSGANTAAGNARTQATAAETAANEASNIADIIRGKLDAGELKGDKGDKGDKGVTGESGVTVPISGLFTLSVEEDTGDLYVYYADGSTPPEFEYNSETGDLYYITPES